MIFTVSRKSHDQGKGLQPCDGAVRVPITEGMLETTRWEIEFADLGELTRFIKEQNLPCEIENDYYDGGVPHIEINDLD